jgi:hypothetical protein
VCHSGASNGRIIHRLDSRIGPHDLGSLKILRFAAKTPMNPAYLFSAILAIALLVYLLIAMFYAERL